jgi:HxlR-like helix-turn-helix
MRSSHEVCDSVPTPWVEPHHERNERHEDVRCDRRCGDLGDAYRTDGEIADGCEPVDRPDADQGIDLDRVRELEAAGLVERRQFAEIPPGVEYSLTPAGRRLAPVIDALAAWGTELLDADAGNRLSRPHRSTYQVLSTRTSGHHVGVQ